MLGIDRRSRTEKATDAAWQTLVERLSDARDMTTDRAGDARHRLHDARTEAGRRASTALGALAGQRPPARWPMAVAGLVGGVALGFLAAQAIRRRRPQLQGEIDREVEREMDTVDRQFAH